jgi:hypothetical protein
LLFFIMNSPSSILYWKILLLSTLSFRGDYHPAVIASAAFSRERSVAGSNPVKLPRRREERSDAATSQTPPHQQCPPGAQNTACHNHQ